MATSDDEQPGKAEAGSGLQDDDKALLRTALKATLAELAGLQVEIERLASCKHPLESYDGAICRECGQDMWPK
jgi:hypothetical protein